MSDNKLGQGWLDNIDKVITENSKLTLFLLIQTIIIALLILGYIKLSNGLQVVVELPKSIKEEGIVVMGKEYANEKFFKMWAREDVEMISVFNATNITNKMQYIKERMYPPSYYKNETILKEYETYNASNLISQRFTFASDGIKVVLTGETNKEATVEIKGYFSKFIDDEEVIKAQECLYNLNYIIEGGRLYVQAFKTTCE